MPDDEEKGPPSLEPPSFFGRKKRGKKPAKDQAVSPPQPTAQSTTQPVAAPVSRDADIRPEVGPVPPPDETPTTILDADQPTLWQPPPGPLPPPLFADERPVQRVAPSAPVAPVASVEPQVPEEPRAPKPPRGPWLTGWAAAIVTGLVVGGLIVGGTSASLRLCTKVRGTESCGNAGFPLLVLILVVVVLVGAVLLRASHVPEPGSTSFLAVGLISVVALLFLIDQLLEWWMVIVIPIVSILTFALAHWVTKSYIEPSIEEDSDEDALEVHDIR
jgi:hypothetical protein